MYNANRLNTDTLLIFDIDGVFFKGILDPHEIVGVIDKKVLEIFRQIIEKAGGCWILTNRPNIFKNFPFIQQISEVIQQVTSEPPSMYSKCSEFLEDRSTNFSIILDAEKPSPNSQRVVGLGMSLFDKVIYIGGRDLPVWFTDEMLLKKIEEKISLDNLTFIEIS